MGGLLMVTLGYIRYSTACRLVLITNMLLIYALLIQKKIKSIIKRLTAAINSAIPP